MPRDPFTLLDLPRRFDLDQADIAVAHRRAASATHPDRFTDPIEQAEAEETAALLNAARRVLANPEQRANALLEILGGPAKEDEKSLPDGFLMEIMEVRQEMEAAVASGDPAERERFEQWAREQRENYIQRVGALFQEIQTSDESPDADMLRLIRVELNAWRYIERMIEQLDPAHQPAP